MYNILCGARLTNARPTVVCAGKNPGECSFDKMVCDSQCRTSVAHVYTREEMFIGRVCLARSCTEWLRRPSRNVHDSTYIIMCGFDTGSGDDDDYLGRLFARKNETDT